MMIVKTMVSAQRVAARVIRSPGVLVCRSMLIDRSKHEHQGERVPERHPFTKDASQWGCEFGMGIFA